MNGRTVDRLTESMPGQAERNKHKPLAGGHSTVRNHSRSAAGGRHVSGAYHCCKRGYLLPAFMRPRLRCFPSSFEWKLPRSQRFDGFDAYRVRQEASATLAVCMGLGLWPWTLPGIVDRVMRAVTNGEGHDRTPEGTAALHLCISWPVFLIDLVDLLVCRLWTLQSSEFETANSACARRH